MSHRSERSWFFLLFTFVYKKCKLIYLKAADFCVGALLMVRRYRQIMELLEFVATCNLTGYSFLLFHLENLEKYGT